MSEEVICAFLRDFREHGQRAIAKVRETQTAAYLKLAVLLVPREHKVEQTNVLAGLSDERLEAMIEEIQDRLDRRAAGSDAKLIEGTAETIAVDATAPRAELGPPQREHQNRLLQHVDTAIGSKERKSKKRNVPPAA